MRKESSINCRPHRWELETRGNFAKILSTTTSQGTIAMLLHYIIYFGLCAFSVLYTSILYLYSTFCIYTSGENLFKSRCRAIPINQNGAPINLRLIQMYHQENSSVLKQSSWVP